MEPVEKLVAVMLVPSTMQGKCREVLETAGCVFGEPLYDDPLWCYAACPQGWTKRATEHEMWTELLDTEGIVRAEIFYVWDDPAPRDTRDTFMRTKVPEENSEENSSG